MKLRFLLVDQIPNLTIHSNEIIEVQFQKENVSKFDVKKEIAELYKKYTHGYDNYWLLHWEIDEVGIAEEYFKQNPNEAPIVGRLNETSNFVTLHTMDGKKHLMASDESVSIWFMKKMIDTWSMNWKHNNGVRYVPDDTVLYTQNDEELKDWEFLRDHLPGQKHSLELKMRFEEFKGGEVEIATMRGEIYRKSGFKHSFSENDACLMKKSDPMLMLFRKFGISESDYKLERQLRFNKEISDLYRSFGEEFGKFSVTSYSWIPHDESKKIGDADARFTIYNYHRSRRAL